MSADDGPRAPSELLPRERQAAEAIRVSRERSGEGFRITPRELREAFGQPGGLRRDRRLTAAEWGVIELALARESLRPQRPLQSLQLDERVGLDLIEPPALERLRRSPYWRLTTKTSKRVYWAIGVFLTLVGAYQFVLPSKPPGPKPMTGRVNIAVAPFSVPMDAGDDTVQAGHAIAQSVYKTFSQQLKESAPQLGLQVRPPDKISALREPRKDAPQLARTIRADMVVHGRIAQTSMITSLMPSLYISARVLPGAAELAGFHGFGRPLVARGPASNPIVGDDLARRLTGRTVALTAFVLGLSFFEVGDYRNAYKRLMAAADEPGWSGDRPEIIELALANAAIKRARYALAARHAARAQAKGRTLRAAFVSVEAAFLRDKGRCERGEINTSAVQRALDGYRRIEAATRSARTGAEPILRSKSQFGAGRALFCLSQALVADRTRESRVSFARVVAAHAHGVTGITEQAAEAEAALGLLAIPVKGDDSALATLQIAAHHYQRAIALTGGDSAPRERNSRQAVFRANLSTVYARMGEAAGARAELTRAIDLEAERRRRASYEQQLKKLR